jgi:hypothetical protein
MEFLQVDDYFGARLTERRAFARSADQLAGGGAASPAAGADAAAGGMSEFQVSRMIGHFPFVRR